ncbi:NlpC/P60 family protein [Embleya sp. NPDC056575]|uniref:NlpC/P60 family protein n=1 Tax=unclassified Embleya TaxID=2699296 RepID=UPI0036CAE24B
MPSIIPIGSVGVDVVPNAKDIYNRLAAQILPDADRVGTDAGKLIGQRIREGIRGSLTDPIRIEGKLATVQAGRAGGDAGGAFGRQMRTRLEAALRALPDIKVGANTSEADSDLQALRVRLESLRNKRIGIDIDTEAARAEAEDIEQQLRRIGAISPNVQVRVDTAAAIAELERMREQIRQATLRPWEVKLEVDGSFGARLRAAVQAAQESLPNINIDSNTDPARARIQGLRAELDALRDVRIGIDMDAGTAQAKIDFIRAELAKLARDTNIDIDIRVDARRARTELRAVQVQADILDRKRINIEVSTGSAMSNILGLVAILGTLIVPPAIGVTAAALGALTAATVTAAVGFGALALVAVPSIIKITSALQAQKAATDAASTATEKAGRSGAQEAVQEAQRALQMEGAQQSLTQAYRQAATQRTQALRAVADAQQGLADAQAQAADRQQQAIARVSEAERKAASADEDARIAQLDLTKARKDAADQLQDLNDQLAGSEISQRRAVLRLQDAKAALDKVLAPGSKASQRDRDEAQLDYDEAVQRLKEQAKDTERLKAQTTEANRVGVDGSDLVTEAQKRLAAAQLGVVDASRDVKAAQVDAAKAQAEGARSIAKAQRQVADAQQHVADVAVQSADQIASAQRGIQSAQLSAAAAAESATGGTNAAATAAAKYQRALADMNPATRATFDAVLRLKDAFKQWSDSLSPTVMPLFTRFIEGLIRSLPALTPIVQAAAGAVGELMDRASRSFQSPWWVQFKSDFVDAMPAAIVGMGVSFGNLFRGIAGIIGAFLPHMDSISERMQRITGRFANWGANLKGSPAFEQFLDDAAKSAPQLGEAFSSIAHAFADISHALAPFRGPLLTVLTVFADTISWIAREAPALVQGLFLAAIAFRAVSISIAAINAASLANPFVLLAAAIIAAIALVVIYWDEIEAGLKWVWEKAIRPVFDAVAAGAMWLWRNGIEPAFEGISTAARLLAAIVLTVLITPLLLAWMALSAAATWLWREAIGPAFSGIGAAAMWLWDNALGPVVGWIADGFGWLGDRAESLYRDWIEPQFRAIGAVIRWVYDWMIQPAVDLATDAFRGLASWATWLHDKMIKPIFDKIGSAVGSVLDGIVSAFDSTKSAVEKTWGGVKEIAAAPIRWVIDTVYTNGIKKVWDKVADVVSLPHLPEVTAGFASGGIMPGYTPGRDNQLIAVGGGEAILRPELTRALGADWVHGGNAAARSGGVAGAQQWLTGMQFGGAFSWGGIVDSIKSGISSIPSPGDVVKGLGELVRGGLAAAAELGFKPIKALIDRIPGDGNWSKLAREVPTRGIDSLIDKLRGDDLQYHTSILSGFGGVMGGIPGPVLDYARRFEGTPYLWGGTTPSGFDCSGLTQYAYTRAGHYPLGRTTYDQVKQGRSIGMSDARPGDLVFEHFGGASPSHVGFFLRPGWIYDAPKPGDVVGPSPMANVVDVRRYLSPELLGGQVTGAGVLRWAPVVQQALAMVGQPAGLLASTLRRMNMESGGDPNAVNRSDANWLRGTPSVGLMQVIGPTYRQYAGPFRDTPPQLYGVSTAPLANVYASMRYALGQYGSLSRAYDREGGYALGGIVPRLYDQGGPLPPGVTLAYNGTGRQEQVYTAQVNRALLTLANRGANAAAAPAGSASGGPALNIENWHAASAEDPRRTAEELRALARVRGR